MSFQLSSVRRETPVAEAIKARRTIKQFKPDAVEEALLRELLEVAVWAPNHRLREPWRFACYVGDGRESLVQAIRRHAKKRKNLDYYRSVPVHLLVVMQESEPGCKWDEDFSAVSSLIQNLQLAAWEQGLGAVWKTDPFTQNPDFKAELGVQAGEKIVGLMLLGYPEQVPQAQPRTALDEKLTVIRTFAGDVEAAEQDGEASAAGGS
ncbi:nitroreductase [Paenibacillus sp. IB182496]|uniref:Putative NAD(P)H nitroreductase n=1 Tax=Paenibacillus sabuli TaxID=2772509 RepID=A0A927BQY2_9BACL|nr:nitroreductase [Paenibacillus sabuli]MBD2844130.1 nitroreductase [Paenibacillus sabuli]